MAANSLRILLLKQCTMYVNDRIAVAQQAIQGAQASANEETKSSSGDKYETGRAMAQLEIEKFTTQLNEGKKLKQQLQQIKLENGLEVVHLGSIVKTSKENYFISIPAGKLTVNDENFYAISIASPIAQKLLGNKAGTTINFNKTEMLILEIL